MIQAIKDLANAFVPSGRLIELVDITLVRVTSALKLSFTVMNSFWSIQYVFCNVLQPFMADTLPEPFSEEIKGIAAVSGVPLGKKTHLLPLCS